MQTLVVAYPRNHHQCYGRNFDCVPDKLDSVDSVPLRKFSGSSCRASQSRNGLLPMLLKPVTVPVNKIPFSASDSNRIPELAVDGIGKCSKRYVNGTTAPISIKFSFEEEGKRHFCESWGGPAYANSPPPSSLPLPVFALRTKRTVSLDLPSLASDIEFLPIANSAPTSPKSSYSTSSSDPIDSTYSATKTLCRILNLDFSDE